MTEKNIYKLYAAGDPLPIDPETGNIDMDKLTDAQREELNAASIKISDAIKNLLPTVDLRGMLAFLQPVQELIDEINALEPFIQEELKKDEYGGLTFDDILAYTPGEIWEMRQDPESTLYKVMEAATAAARAAEKSEEGKPERTTAKRARTVEYPLDKPNAYIWNLLEKDTAGQVSFNLAKYGSKKAIPAVYAIDFDSLGSDITITKRLLPFDKRAYIAVSALFNAGNNVITLSQIYYTMGNTGRPSTKQLEKLNTSITKMTGARILFDNKQEAESYKYPHFQYDGSLLPIERKTAIVNGQLADAAIHIFREPPLITFAKQRKQITTIDIKLLQSPVNKTDDNLLIDDYLLERISRAKNGKAKNCRILYKTIYSHIGIAEKPGTAAERKAKQRAPKKIEIYLSYYQECGFITRYTTEPDGMTIYWK